MKSEYIPRLREELVAAAARERAGVRRRPRARARRLVPALATAAVLAAVLVAALVVELPRDEAPVAPEPAGAALAYRAVPAGRADAAAELLRERIAAAGVRGATVSVDGDRVRVDAGARELGQVDALAVPGKLAIYDWEASVLGPDGRPAPADDGVTGGQGAGAAGAMSRQEASRRAAKDPGARIVRGEGSGWYALADDVAVGNADVANARGRLDPMTGDPVVAIELDAGGRAAFGRLTRGIAQRGADGAKPGQNPLVNAQHFAVVLDDRIVSTPFINYQHAPDGISGEDGMYIAGAALTPERARQIATILESGPLPATLAPVEGSQSNTP